MTAFDSPIPRVDSATRWLVPSGFERENEDRRADWDIVASLVAFEIARQWSCSQDYHA